LALPQVGGHDRFAYQPADGVAAFAAKCFFGCRIELNDQTGFVDRNNAVES